MYVFAGQMRLRDTEPFDRDLYRRMGFERVRGRVTSMDAEARRLRLKDGSDVAYDRLLLATGFESQRIIVRDGRVVGFNMLGSRWNHEVLLEWIHERRSLDWVLKRLPAAQFDEELSPRFRVVEEAVEMG